MKTQRHSIAASLLAADFARLGEDAAAALDAGADLLHLDAMDNHYVPNLTFGAPVCAALRRALPKAKMEAHLMTSPVDNLIAPFANAGADALIFHPEAENHPHRTLRAIADAGMKAGVALNPGTPLAVLDNLLDEADIVLMMTVNPGFGGQKFINSVLEKVAAAKKMIAVRGKTVSLQVDGGVNSKNAIRCADAGADVLIAGNSIFSGGAKDYAKKIAALRGK